MPRNGTHIAAFLRMHLRATALAAVLTALALGGSADAATITQIQFQGTTTGCFGSGCSVFTSPATTTLGGQTVTFTGDSFDETTDISGAATFNLGTFSRSGSFTSSFNDAPFTLQVTFALPSNITGGQSTLVNALIDGTVSMGNSLMMVSFVSNSISLQFVNSLGQGSFDLLITDPATINNANNSRPLNGGIANAMFDEFETVTPVPEPTSLLLLGAGLGAAAVGARRRRSRRA